MSGLTNITNGTDYDSQVYIEAQGGGLIDLSKVANMVDGNGGDTRLRAIVVSAAGSANGTPSTVKLTNLTSFTDRQAGDTNLAADNAFSRLEAFAGGVLLTPALAFLDGIYVDEDALSTINTTQVVSLTDGLVDFTGPVLFDVSNVKNLAHTTVNVAGAGRVVTFAKATNIDGTSFSVATGTHLSLPAATTYNHADTADNQVRTWQVTGAGSVLSLAGLTSITNGLAYFSQIHIQADAGGQIDLGSLTKIAEGLGGDNRGHAVVLTASGASSTIKLNALTTFTDLQGGDPNLGGNNAFSRLDAYAGGSLQTPALTTLDNVIIDVDAASFVVTSQITTLTDGAIDFTGAATYDLSNVTNLARTSVSVNGAGRVVNLPRATNIDGASFVVTGGAHLSLPAATSYSHAATIDNQNRYFQATGSSSVLSLSGLTSITNSTRYFSQLFISALGGGVIDLSAVTQIADGNGGDLRGRAVIIAANGSAGGTASTINLAALTTFTDAQGGDLSLSNNNAFSRLNAYNGGVLQTPALTALDGVYIDEDSASSINTSALATLTDGLIDFTGPSTYVVANITNLTHTTVKVAGAGRTIVFPKAATIDGANFYVSGGASLSLPVATSYNHAPTSPLQNRYFQATGSSSVLSLAGLKSITNGTSYFSQIYVDALSGGVIDLSGVTQIADGNGGDLRSLAVVIRADGSGSTVKLNALTTFTDAQGGDTNLADNNAYSRLNSYNGGVLQTPAHHHPGWRLYRRGRPQRHQHLPDHYLHGR